MTRKKRHAQKPAAAEQKTLEQGQPAGGAEQEAPALVAGDGDPASVGAEHKGGAAGEAGRPGGSWLGDADIPYAPGGHDAVVQATEPGGAAQGDGTTADRVDDIGLVAAVGEDEGDESTHAGNDGSDDSSASEIGGSGAALEEHGGSLDAGVARSHGGDGNSDPAATADAMDDGTAFREKLRAEWPDTVRSDVKFVEALPHDGMAMGDQVMTYVDGVYTCFEWRGEPPAWDFVASIGAPFSIPDNDDDADFADPERSFSRALEEDPALRAAFMAMQEAVKPLLFAVAGEHEELWLYDKLLTIDGMGFLEAARCLREIGHVRATVDVVATQLRLAGHLPSGRVDGPQRVLLEIFLFTLAAIDGHAKAVAEERARAEAEANRTPPTPVPIEDTTLEMVDDTMATW